MPFALSWLPHVPDGAELSVVAGECFAFGKAPRAFGVTLITPICVPPVIPENAP